MSETGPILREEEMQRYKRQLLLPEVGLEGQKRIKAAGIMIMGAGGLGSPVAYYLAAAGVGKITVVDDDQLEISNLNRQILHNSDRIGMYKAESAKRTISSLNPAVEVKVFCERLISENAVELIDESDLVVDCTDNFSTRFILNEACLRIKKPLFYGAVTGMEGQVMTILPGEGPCYRCLYPEEPRNMAKPAPVIGVLPGIIGLIQATQVLKYILGQGDLLAGRLLVYNALAMELYSLPIKKSPRCPACGSK
ncbi:MAG TPA: adenylyltransferase [Desulfotomaculum sp.]|nr:MAG: UBA/THIF-type NAD/FAD binding protein [Desulfotomaculum sp. 46_80]HAG11279.1 adenylyltransferase [Desulfotomaculum sp.]HBY03573.1 adenylyltransferase [Desulfotomaculum sp.]